MERLVNFFSISIYKEKTNSFIHTQSTIVQFNGSKSSINTDDPKFLFGTDICILK